MHQLTETSRAAYKKQNESGKRISDKEKIYSTMVLFINSEPFTRERLSLYLNIKYATVCGRINDLLQEGFVSVCGEADGKELLKANIEPVPYIPPFKLTKENVAILLHRQTNKSIQHCNLIIEDFIKAYKQ